MAELDPLLVPIQLDAFVLNNAVCGQPHEDGARICPITQPNYTFLRFDNAVAQSDVMPDADLHNATPASRNPRMTDLGTGLPRRNRWGVYLHWTLPRVYRTGVATTATEEEQGQEGAPPGRSSSQAKCLDAPTRWLVIRKLALDSVRPVAAASEFPEYEAWVVESDHVWHLDDVPLEADLQVDVSPFVRATAGAQVDVAEQAEIFIGRKTRLREWKNAPAPTTRLPRFSLQDSGNQLFADFQLHNSNVFSIVDNFQYGTAGRPRYLEAARASYYVMGWHGDGAADPLAGSDGRTRQERLQSMFMTLGSDSEGDQTVQEWLGSTAPTRLICHGAMYHVQWDESRKPTKVPADDFAQKLRDPQIPTVSVGTTALDALITYLAARKTGHSDSDDAIGQVEESILALQSLLYGQDDGVEGQRQAKDMLYHSNFTPASGGRQYFLPHESNTDDNSTASRREKLRELNLLQALLDALERDCEQLRWEMFSAWWKYVTDSSGQRDVAAQEILKGETEKRAETIRRTLEELERLRQKVATLTQTLDSTDPARKIRLGAQPLYYRARDPTVLVGGIDPGWPDDYLELLRARLAAHVISGTQTAGGKEALRVLKEEIENALNGTGVEELLPVMQLLVNEFEGLAPSSSNLGTDHASYPQTMGGEAIPQKQEEEEEEKEEEEEEGGTEAASTGVEQAPAKGRFPQFRGRDIWNERQPWRPLYMEWEVEYWHVPFDWWSLEEQAARLSDNRQVRYGLDGSTKLWKRLEDVRNQHQWPMADTRIISGRVLILPQPGFSLRSRLQQLFTDTPAEELDKMLPESARQQLMASVSKLPFLSAPLSGLTESLLTLSQGTHIKPENQETTAEGEKFTVIENADFPEAGFDRERLAYIQGRSGLTPFAGKYSFTDSPHHPFKPVTHGQVRFRKLNIIDKFGQTLVAIDPPSADDSVDSLYPCISDFYEPQLITVDGHPKANTVVEDLPGLCQFVQLPPQINQNVRLNAEFVLPSNINSSSSSSSIWSPAAEWDNPVWGWIVANYANHAIQFFLGDGTFYREVRLGGPDGALSQQQPKWGPFRPPTPGTPKSNAQFDQLIQHLSNQPAHLKEFWTVITEALRCLPDSPESYASTLPAMVGRPLALVNMGWSLELDRRWSENQSTQVASGALSAQPAHYQLPVKLGDAERRYDGLVGYFVTNTEAQPTTVLRWDQCYTHFVPSSPPPPAAPSHRALLHPINRLTYPKFSPFWVEPWDAEQQRWLTPHEYEARRNSHLRIFGAILDPFAPVKGYSSFLPPRSLQLPAWVAQQAISRMAAFFHVGPVVVTDPPEKDDKYPGTQGTRPIALPGLGTASEWVWWQPYEGEASEEHPDDGGGAPKLEPERGSDDEAGAEPVAERKAIFPRYTDYELDRKTTLEAPAFQPGPYTAIEGFLQMKKPVKS